MENISAFTLFPVKKKKGNFNNIFLRISTFGLFTKDSVKYSGLIEVVDSLHFEFKTFYGSFQFLI